MAAQSIQPLRVQKGTNSTNSSPKKDLSFAQHRPLSELSPMALRRNSPSFPRNSFSKHEPSPSASSPYTTASPKMFWHGRDPNSPSSENRSPFDSISPAKRSSIENLKKASRVKNSSMFAKEQQINYDPSDPKILDGKPLRTSIQGNAFRGSAIFSASTNSNASDGTPTPTSPTKAYHLVTEQPSQISTLAQHDKLESSPFHSVAPLSPSKLSSSPTKSSFSKKTGANFRRSGFDPSTGIWEDEDDEEKELPAGRGLHRHAKSVTFDQAPPQINEYEMTTPDPSSVASGSREGSYESFDDEEDCSFERSSSFDPHDDSFDASLEDTEKTPVVLPEDWRFMSPDTVDKNLAKEDEDVFNDHVGSPAPEAQPGAMTARPHQSSAQSVDSDGHARPLPPLPPMQAAATERRSSNRDSLSGTLERISGTHRALPSPPPAAAITAADIRRMSNSTFSLEDCLKMMALQDTAPQSDADAQRERRMRRAASKESSPVREQYKQGEPREEHDELTPEPVPQAKSENRRLSRDFITQQLRLGDDNMSRSNSQSSTATLDPDVAIPSREDPTQTFDDEYEDDSIVVKDEPIDDDELYQIPEMYRKTSSQLDAEDEMTSQYSQSSIQKSVDLNFLTPRAQTPVRGMQTSISSERMSLPDFMDFGEERDYGFGLGQYITRESKDPARHVDIDRSDFEPPKEALPDLAALRSEIVRPFTPEEQLVPPKPIFAQEEKEPSEPGTPSSVIRHPISKSVSPETEEEDSSSLAKTDSNAGSIPSVTLEEAGSEIRKDLSMQPTPEAEAPSTKVEESLDNPEPEKKRTGNRVSSLVQLDFPRDNSSEGLGLGLEAAFDRVLESQKVAFESSLKNLYHPFHGRFPSAELLDAKELSGLSRPAPIPLPPGPFGPRAPSNESKFTDRRPNQQRGYLMRQNTKIVVATERASVDEPRSPTTAQASGSLASPSVPPNEVVPSPRKTSQPAWVAEPWNNKSRRRSIRVNGDESPKRKPLPGPAPPLPGQVSNVGHELDIVAEDDLAEEEAEELEDGAERGRLFVKVVGVKDLQLPFPQRKRPRELGQIPADQSEEEKTYFALTLDNGLHCVTTSWLDLARSAPIGQEFELVVLNDLEFQLTLQMKLEEPPKPVIRPESPTKAPASPKKQNAFGRLFGSPKKRKESDVRAPEPPAVKRPVTPPSAYELVQGIVAKDGSFARAYVQLGEFEKQAYGRPANVDIKCFNEWAMEEVSVGSSRSKKGVIQLQRRPPYEIGKLELQLLYVPKPKGAKDEDMPKSMNGAIRAMREAEEKLKQQREVKEFEGFLSQQGGDCPYWRRRFFKLVGTKLTAYHETTRQPRATINLAKAAKLIDDKANLAKKEVSTKKGGRRKSAFAEDEEGYMFVEEGFRVRFANGEVIDFYAENAAIKDEWMAALSQAVGKQVAHTSSSSNGWTEMVLKREKSTRAKSTPARPDVPMRTPSKEKDLPARPPVDTTQGYQHPQSHSAMMMGALKSATPMSPPQQSSIPRPSGHSRTESYQADAVTPRSQANSPTKSRPSRDRDERHRKTRSMWG